MPTSHIPAHLPSAPLALQKPPPLTKETMAIYLASPDRFDCVVQIFHARVAQKSYGNEKRFFCPPPCVYLTGNGWNVRRETIAMLRKEQLKVGNELNAYDRRVHIGIEDVREQDPLELDFSNGKDYCAAKALYISDAEKRKYFKLYVLISMFNKYEVGRFLSTQIKVISKPPKKKGSPKENDSNYLFITSGKKVALFNRLRSQTVSTRYLHVENGGFHASSSKWGAFTIHLVDEAKSPTNSDVFFTKDGNIYYGAVVKLVDSCSNTSLPRLRVCKVDKNNVLLENPINHEPVSQLHKCAFQFVDSPDIYLCLSGDKIIQKTHEHKNGMYNVVDGAAWTITSTEKVEYRFFEAMGPAAEPVSPAPIIDAISHDISTIEQNAADGGRMFVRLNGRDFDTRLTVWFGTIPCETIYRSPEMLEFTLPTLEQVLAEPATPNVCDYDRSRLDVPILLVRDDGVIYSSDVTFTFIREGIDKRVVGST